MSDKSSTDTQKVELATCQKECTCQPAILAFNLACKDKDIGKEALEALFEKINLARAGCLYHHVRFLNHFSLSFIYFSDHDIK